MPGKRGGKRLGFTLIELMLVVAIIGLLAAIAIPKFSDMVIRAKEAAIKGKLGALRSAVTIYYADNEGIYPQGLFALVFASRYLDELPFIDVPRIPSHRGSTESSVLSDGIFTFKNQAWFYNSGIGQVNVNCTHTDTKGIYFSSW
jgi:prepilin-type N-terminal cleavage/methylation domain-containing protein